MEQAFPNLPSLEHVTSMAQSTADPSFWYVLNKAGQLYWFDNSSDAGALSPALDISNKVANFGENGALSVAVHPNYPSDPRVFIVYSDSSNGDQTTLASFTANTNTHVLDPNSEETVLSIEKFQPEHVGGDIAFGTDGYLYLSVGDDGWGTEQNTPSQNQARFLGSILRIDVSTQPYSIPTGNPYAGNPLCNGSFNGGAQNCPEIFAWGFRNPWRISIDSETNQLWVGDVGDSAYEEINRVNIGTNYGWPSVEGRSCTSMVPGCNPNNFENPVVAYAHGGASSVIGGYVYRGELSPSLVGKYIYADFNDTTIHIIDATDNALTGSDSSFSSPGQISSFAQGADGEIYALNYQAGGNGEMIYRIVDSGGVNIDVPDRLSNTGCFNVATKNSASGVFDYDINSKLWSDGADKLRSFAIPDGTFISVDDDGDFIFPEGTVLIKHFLHNNDFLETRLLIRYENGVGWRGYSYEWDLAQEDAFLLAESERKTRDVSDFVHQYPNRNDCSACHSGAANSSLGLELAQQNLVSESLNSNIIDYLSAAGYFNETQVSTSSPRLYAIDDDTASVEQRVRSYLHSNCSGCHRPGGAFSVIDLRYNASFNEMNLCNVAPTAGDLGLSNARRVVPGAPERSVLLARMQATDDNRMPPLGTLDEDTAATALVSAWISGLSSCP